MSIKKTNPQIHRILAYSFYTISFSLVMRGAIAFTMDDFFGGIRNGVNSVASGGKTQPVPVPNAPAPVGTAGDINPCAAPPPVQQSYQSEAHPYRLSKQDRFLLNRLRYPQNLESIQRRFGAADETGRGYVVYGKVLLMVQGDRVTQAIQQ